MSLPNQPTSPLVQAALQDMVNNLVALVKQEAPDVDFNCISLHWTKSLKTPYLFIHLPNIAEIVPIDQSIKLGADRLVARAAAESSKVKLAFHNANA